LVTVKTGLDKDRGRRHAFSQISAGFATAKARVDAQTTPQSVRFVILLQGGRVMTGRDRPQQGVLIWRAG
jgi:hypothetical protein